jgi:hypothetical protein
VGLLCPGDSVIREGLRHEKTLLRACGIDLLSEDDQLVFSDGFLPVLTQLDE